MVDGQFRFDTGVDKDILLDLGLDASGELYAPFLPFALHHLYYYYLFYHGSLNHSIITQSITYPFLS